MLPVGEAALESAFHEYTHLVHQSSLNNQSIESELWETGFFTYQLTPKQISVVKRLCREQGWKEPENISGMTIRGEFVKHVIDARTHKDGTPINEIASILAITFHKRSQIALNANRPRQGLIINATKRITVRGNTKCATAAFSVDEEELMPKTGYDSTWNKVKRKLGRKDARLDHFPQFNENKRFV